MVKKPFTGLFRYNKNEFSVFEKNVFKKVKVGFVLYDNNSIKTEKIVNINTVFSAIFKKKEILKGLNKKKLKS